MNFYVRLVSLFCAWSLLTPPPRAGAAPPDAAALADSLETQLASKGGVLDQLLGNEFVNDVARDPLRLVTALERDLHVISGKNSKILGNLVKANTKFDNVLEIARQTSNLQKAWETASEASKYSDTETAAVLGMASYSMSDLSAKASDVAASLVTRGMGGSWFGGLAGFTAGYLINGALQDYGQSRMDRLMVSLQREWESKPLTAAEKQNMNPELRIWDSVLNHRPPADLQEHILRHRAGVMALKGSKNYVNWFFQRIDDAVGPVYYDLYMVRVRGAASGAKSPFQTVDHIRRNFPDFFPRDYFLWEPYNYKSANTSLTGGSVLNLGMRLPGHEELLEDGAFAVSGLAGGWFMLSPIYAAGHRYRDSSGGNPPGTPGPLQQQPGPYYNPFSGNRRFGYTYSKAGELILYTQGAFRLANPEMQRIDSDGKSRTDSHGVLVSTQRAAMLRFQNLLAQYIQSLGLQAEVMPEILLQTDARLILQTRSRPGRDWVDSAGNGDTYGGLVSKRKDPGFISFFAGVERFDQGRKRHVETPRVFQPADFFSGAFPSTAIADWTPQNSPTGPNGNPDQPSDDPGTPGNHPGGPSNTPGTPGNHPAQPTPPGPNAPTSKSLLAGITVRGIEAPEYPALGLTEAEGGVLVTEIAGGSPAEGQLLEQDVLLGLEGETEPLRSQKDFADLVKATQGKSRLRVVVVRGQRVKTVQLFRTSK